MENNIQNLINEIHNILPELDSDSLIFLKDQASVLLYNKEIQQKNALFKEQQNNREKKPPVELSDQIESMPVVYIEQLKNGKFFNLCIQDAKLFMDYKEIRAIFKIARAAETPETGAAALFNWFKKERNDVLVEGYITSRAHPALLLVYRELLETFTTD